MFIYHQPVEARETLGCSIVAGLIRDKMGLDSKCLVSSARTRVVYLVGVGLEWDTSGLLEQSRWKRHKVVRMMNYIPLDTGTRHEHRRWQQSRTNDKWS